MSRTFQLIPIFSIVILTTCQQPMEKGTFQYDLEFFKGKKETIVLSSEGGKSQLLLVADYQGRVMTSTSKGLEGRSYGWINHNLIASGELVPKINAVGGEDRFWLGPEGGQYSIYFKKGDEFTFDNWQTPAVIDTESYEVVSQSETSVLFEKQFQLTNYQGFSFDLKVDREISIFDKKTVEGNLDIEINNRISFVGYQSKNTVMNKNDSTWTKDNGLLSIWILGMFNPSENTTVIVPYKDSLNLNTAYFGEIGNDRLRVDGKAVFFKGDGKYRSKIGLPPENATSLLGSYNADHQVLTIVQYSFEGDSSYVNSLWELQDQPYRGDVVNAYNDGSLDNGDQLGPFYELESSSSAKELNSGESMTHVHKTYHFEGDKEALNRISKNVLGVDIDEIPFN